MDSMEKLMFSAMKSTLLKAAKEDGEHGDFGADMLLMATCFEQIKHDHLRQTFSELLSLAFMDAAKYIAMSRVINMAVGMMKHD